MTLRKVSNRAGNLRMQPGQHYLVHDPLDDRAPFSLWLGSKNTDDVIISWDGELALDGDAAARHNKSWRDDGLRAWEFYEIHAQLADACAMRTRHTGPEGWNRFARQLIEGAKSCVHASKR